MGVEGREWGGGWNGAPCVRSMALGVSPGAIVHIGGGPRARIPTPANFRPSTFDLRPELRLSTLDRPPPSPHSAIVPKSNPGTETRGIDSPIVRSIVRTIAISSGAMNVYASPVVAARPVRPIRWT